MILVIIVIAVWMNRMTYSSVFFFKIFCICTTELTLEQQGGEPEKCIQAEEVVSITFLTTGTVVSGLDFKLIATLHLY